MKDRENGGGGEDISFSAQRNHKRLISNVSAGFNNNPADTNLTPVQAAPHDYTVGRYAKTLTIMIDYRPARLVKTKDRWYIVYYQTNPVSKTLERFRSTFELGRYPIEHRLSAATEIINRINSRLPYGYPFDEDFYSRNVAISVRKAFDLVTAAGEDLRQATKHSYAYSMRKFLTFAESIRLADEPVEAITRKVAMAFSDHITLQGLSGRSHNNDINEMRRVFNVIKSRDLITVNPFDNIPKRREAEKLRRDLTKSEMEIILAYAYTQDKSVFLSCALLYFCLIRPNEQRQLRRSNINLANHTILVEGQYSKNRKTQAVTIPDQLSNILIELGINDLKPDQFLLGPVDKLGRDQPISKSRISSRYRLMIQDLHRQKILKNITGNHLYSWKDSGAASMRDEGIDAFSLMEQGRWHSLAMAQKYLSERTTANEFIRRNHVIQSIHHPDRYKPEE